MIIGVLSDTHEDRMNAIPYVVKEFKKWGVDVIVHCGDIKQEHINPELFNNLPVFCALTDEQTKLNNINRDANNKFFNMPANWIFTYPNKRIVDLGEFRTYVGHKRSFEILAGSEHKLMETLNNIRKEYDNVRFLFSGHTHHQILMRNRLISFINPGSIEDSIGIAGGYEYTIIDTESDKIIFSRIPAKASTKKTLKLAIISDSFDISEADPDFWGKLADVLKKEKVTHIIHCGNLDLDDIAMPELGDFNVYYNLRKDQVSNEAKKADNWHLINTDKPFDIEGYKFYVQLNLGYDLLNQSEFDMHCLALEIQKRYPEVRFILCGLTHGAFYEEGENSIILNPGDIIKNENYVIAELPKYEITFVRVLNSPLPPLN